MSKLPVNSDDILIHVQSTLAEGPRDRSPNAMEVVPATRNLKVKSTDVEPPPDHNCAIKFEYPAVDDGVYRNIFAVHPSLAKFQKTDQQITLNGFYNNSHLQALLEYLNSLTGTFKLNNFTLDPEDPSTPTWDENGNDATADPNLDYNFEWRAWCDDPQALPWGPCLANKLELNFITPVDNNQQHFTQQGGRILYFLQTGTTFTDCKIPDESFYDVDWPEHGTHPSITESAVSMTHTFPNITHIPQISFEMNQWNLTNRNINITNTTSEVSNVPIGDWNGSDASGWAPPIYQNGTSQMTSAITTPDGTFNLHTCYVRQTKTTSVGDTYGHVLFFSDEETSTSNVYKIYLGVDEQIEAAVFSTSSGSSTTTQQQLTACTNLHEIGTWSSEGLVFTDPSWKFTPDNQTIIGHSDYVSESPLLGLTRTRESIDQLGVGADVTNFNWLNHLHPYLIGSTETFRGDASSATINTLPIDDPWRVSISDADLYGLTATHFIPYWRTQYTHAIGAWYSADPTDLTSLGTPVYETYDPNPSGVAGDIGSRSPGLPISGAFPHNMDDIKYYRFAISRDHNKPLVAPSGSDANGKDITYPQNYLSRDVFQPNGNTRQCIHNLDVRKEQVAVITGYYILNDEIVHTFTEQIDLTRENTSDARILSTCCPGVDPPPPPEPPEPPLQPPDDEDWYDFTSNRKDHMPYVLVGTPSCRERPDDSTTVHTARIHWGLSYSSARLWNALDPAVNSDDWWYRPQLSLDAHGNVCLPTYTYVDEYNQHRYHSRPECESQTWENISDIPGKAKKTLGIGDATNWTGMIGIHGTIAGHNQSSNIVFNSPGKFQSGWQPDLQIPEPTYTNGIPFWGMIGTITFTVHGNYQNRGSIDVHLEIGNISQYIGSMSFNSDDYFYDLINGDDFPYHPKYVNVNLTVNVEQRFIPNQEWLDANPDYEGILGTAAVRNFRVGGTSGRIDVNCRQTPYTPPPTDPCDGVVYRYSGNQYTSDSVFQITDMYCNNGVKYYELYIVPYYNWDCTSESYQNNYMGNKETWEESSLDVNSGEFMTKAEAEAAGYCNSGGTWSSGDVVCYYGQPGTIMGDNYDGTYEFQDSTGSQSTVNGSDLSAADMSGNCSGGTGSGGTGSGGTGSGGFTQSYYPGDYITSDSNPTGGQIDYFDSTTGDYYLTNGGVINANDPGIMG